MLYVATGRRSWLLIGVVLFVVGSLGAYHFVGHVHERVQIWLHPLDPPLHHRPELPARAGPVRSGHRRHLRHRARARAAPTWCRSPTPTSSPRRSPRSSGSPGSWRSSSIYLLIVMRGTARRARHPRRLRQAARRRAGVRLGASGLRPGRRRHPADPADRPDPAVPVLRRVEPDLQLDPARPAAADQRRRPPAAARPAARRRTRPRRWWYAGEPPAPPRRGRRAA